MKDIRKILDNLQEIHKVNRRTNLGKQATNKGSNFSIAKKASGTLYQKNTERSLLTSNSIKPTQANLHANESKAVYRSQSIGVQNSSSNVNVNLKPVTRGSVVITAHRKQSLKIHCHYELIEATKKANDDKEKENNEIKASQPKNYNLYRLLTLQSPNAILNNSVEMPNKKATEETKSEKENVVFEEYIKKNNIIVATNMNTFNVFKKVLVSENQNYELFDYSDYTIQVCKVQACYKAYQARRKYKIYRYVVRKLIMLQKYVRGWIIRMKFDRYKRVTTCVSRIQTVFKF